MPGDHAIADVYSLLDKGQDWHPVLDRLRERFWGQSLAINRSHPACGGENLFATGLSEWAAASYRDHYGLIDPVAKMIPSIALSKPVGVRALAGPQALDSEFFVDWTGPADCDDTLFMRLPVSGPSHLCLAVGRPYDGRRDYRCEQLDDLEALAPHLGRVFETLARRQEVEKTMQRLLAHCEAMGEAIVLLGSDGEVVGEGAGLDDLAVNGHEVVRREGRIFIEGRELGYIVRRQERLERLSIRRLESDGDSVALVCLFDPDLRDRQLATALERLFDLTPSEVRVALAVRDHRGLVAVGGALRVSLSTVRVHLQHVFEKTETHRQADLVQLMDQLARGITPR